VEVRHRFARWEAETEDLGPYGIQLVTPRLVTAGREVRLAVSLPALSRTVMGTGQVVWARAETPSRLGLRFAPDKSEGGWFDSLLARDPDLSTVMRRRPERLALRAKVYLGQVPSLVVDFSRDELAVLQRLRPGMTVTELVTQFGAAPERLVGALFALISRRQITLDPAYSASPAAWRETLDRAEAAEVIEGLTPEHRLRHSAVDRLLLEGRGHLAAGRLELAGARFREARALAPHDKEIERYLRSLGRFG
jgi:hypothetical protein